MPRINKTLLLCCLMGMASVLAAAPNDAEVRLFEVQMTMAKNGDVKAQYYVGEMYEKGLGTAQDLRQAKEWYTQAAKQGSRNAKLKLENWDRITENAQMTPQGRVAEIAKQSEAAKAREAAKVKAAREAREQERQAELARVREQQELAAKAKKEQQGARNTAAAQKAKQPPAPVRTQSAVSKSPEPEPPKAVVSEAEGVKFETNPCKGPSAKFLSTCK